MALIEIKVPDIGDFKDVEIIEVLVQPGDAVEQEASLVTLESDKASMEVPSSDSGVVKKLQVQVGEKVSEGRVLLLLETEAAATSPEPSQPEVAAEAPQAVPSPSPGKVAWLHQIFPAFPSRIDNFHAFFQQLLIDQP